MITQKQCDEIMNLISKYCCRHCSPFCCYETDNCDILDIFQILSNNVEREAVSEEEEKLPFALDDELL